MPEARYMTDTRTFLNGRCILHCGDCVAVLATLPPNSVDSIVCDPPYGLEFMGKEWDSFGKAPTGGASFSKDGMGKGFKALPSFLGSPNPNCRNCGGSQRGNDRKGFKRCRCDAPDFPNSRLKQMVAFQESCEAWARECLRVLKPGGYMLAFGGTKTQHRMVVAIEDAGFEIRDQIGWIYGQGFPKNDSSLKPAWEPVCVARKPLIGTVAANEAAHGTGRLNIDDCRISTDDKLNAGAGKLWSHYRDGEASAERRYADKGGTNFAAKPGPRGGDPAGRYPANIIHDGSQEVVAAFPDAPGQQPAVGPEHGAKKTVNCYGDFGPREQFNPRGDSGSAARFYYAAKADADDRLGSKHPTVKPVDLMQYLVRLVTPRDGVVLDPFGGTGTTGEAAWREGRRSILIEREAEYQDDIARRMELAENPTKRAAVAKTKNNLVEAADLPLFAQGK